MDYEELRQLQVRFPFVEWGILLSASSAGRSRYPSVEWFAKMVAGHEHLVDKFKLSGHICGRWIDDIRKGKWTVLKEYSQIGYFDRLQLNWHGQKRRVVPDFLDGFIKYNAGRKERNLPEVEIIFQLDGVNDHLLVAGSEQGLKVSGLVDTSHGSGTTPAVWPKSTQFYTGYSGGLGPDNLREELEKIAEVCDGPIWIDAETRLRSDNDRIFDLDKVYKFLEKAEPWVMK